MSVRNLQLVYLTILFIEHIGISKKYPHAPRLKIPPPFALSHPLIESIIISELISNINSTPLIIIHISHTQSIERCRDFCFLDRAVHRNYLLGPSNSLFNCGHHVNDLTSYRDVQITGVISGSPSQIAAIKVPRYSNSSSFYFDSCFIYLARLDLLVYTRHVSLPYDASNTPSIVSHLNTDYPCRYNDASD